MEDKEDGQDPWFSTFPGVLQVLKRGSKDLTEIMGLLPPDKAA